jgi:hypothetical protein
LEGKWRIVGLGLVAAVAVAVALVIWINDSERQTVPERLASDLGGCPHELNLRPPGRGTQYLYGRHGWTQYARRRMVALVGITDTCEGPEAPGGTGAYARFKSHRAMKEAMVASPQLKHPGLCISRRATFQNTSLGRQFITLCRRVGFRVVKRPPVFYGSSDTPRSYGD